LDDISLHRFYIWLEGSIMADIRTSSLGGVPKGETADRPSSPSIGDVFYNGTLGCLEIYTSQGWVANSAPPGIPTIGTATYSATNKAYNNASASIAFTPGEGGGLPNLYRATSTPGGYSGTATSSPITVSGLQSTVAYTFSVTGTNNFGTSASSTNSNSITANTVPQAPSITAVDTQNGGSVDITITPGATGGSAITGYTIVSNPATTTQTTSSTSYTFTGLTNGTAYTFTATATNANGTSLSSAATASVTPNLIAVVNALIVAGGGGGSDAVLYGGRGGAGGAGGLLYYGTETPKTPNGSALSLYGGTTYNVLVGGGGTRSSYSGSPIVYVGQGVNSSFSTYTALAGGYGGPNDSPYGDGGTGGSGGGSWYFGVGGQGTSGQGNNGGGNTTSPNYGGGGGGGAGAAGGNGTTGSGGNGGNGLQYSISGSSTYYAGGGSGSTYGPTGNSPGTAGLGGGGTGSNSNGSGANATANTGGGGGMGGTGGSGVVVLRSSRQAVSTTGSPTYTNLGAGIHIYRYTANGSITF
jgi:trimeric autotransporter adhesin